LPSLAMGSVFRPKGRSHPGFAAIQRLFSFGGKGEAAGGTLFTIEGGGLANRHNPHNLYALGERLALSDEPSGVLLTVNLIEPPSKRNK
jgi:hypothetical protein